MFKNFKCYIALFLCFFLSSFAFAQSVTPLFHGNNDPVAGNPKGKVTVVEFFDFQCSHCAAMAPVMESVIKSNPNVRVVFKDLPIRGPVSLYATKAALAANKQGKYGVFSHALFKANEPLTETTILDIAKKTGLNINKLKKDMESSSITDQIKANYKLAKDWQLTGTPAFFVGKTDAQNNEQVNYYLGEMSQSQLTDAIEKANS